MSGLSCIRSRKEDPNRRATVDSWSFGCMRYCRPSRSEWPEAILGYRWSPWVLKTSSSCSLASVVPTSCPMIQRSESTAALDDAPLTQRAACDAAMHTGAGAGRAIITSWHGWEGNLGVDGPQVEPGSAVGAGNGVEGVSGGVAAQALGHDDEHAASAEEPGGDEGLGGPQ